MCVNIVHCVFVFKKVIESTGLTSHFLTRHDVKAPGDYSLNGGLVGRVDSTSHATNYVIDRL